MDSLAELRDAWNDDPLAVGVTLYAQVPNDSRPTWAADILSFCCDRVASVPRPVTHVATLASDPKRWKRAHDAFSGVRRLTLAAENKPVSELKHYLLYVAENAAKVIYNASGSSAPFDTDSGAWLVRCAKEFADCDSSTEFADALWAVVTKHAAHGT